MYLPGPQGGPFLGFIGLASGPAGANRESIHAMAIHAFFTEFHFQVTFDTSLHQCRVYFNNDF